MPGINSFLRSSQFVFLLVWLFSGVYMGMVYNKGWDPADEGTFGQSAERVLNGEIPHKDFEDPYTGGLAYLDAFIFKHFGINLVWLRLFLFACFLVWVPVVFLLAREFLVPWPAGGVTLVAVAWSVPNYTAATPSWFNLFLTTFGTFALAKYVRKPATHWLILAGLSGGVSFLFKSVALYYIAGALLFFVYREQSLSREEQNTAKSTPVFLVFLTACLVTFVFSLIKLVFAVGAAAEYLHFVLPGAAITCLLLARESIAPTNSSSVRFRILLRMGGPFLLAAAIPISLFGMYYWHQGALPALLKGVFVNPMRRLSTTHAEPIGLLLEYPSVLVALFILEAAKLTGGPRRALSLVLGAIAALVLFTSPYSDLSNIIGLTSALGSIPVLVIAALIVLLPRRSSSAGGSRKEQLLTLLLMMSALFSLIQFPYASPGYFCYVAPLDALLAAYLISGLPKPPRIVLYTAVAFYVLFAMFVFRPHYLGSHFHPEPDNASLMMPRTGNLEVTGKSAAEYKELIAFTKIAAGEGPLLAGPDCPEIYFLSGIKNRTPVLFDSLEDPFVYEHSMKALLNRPDFLRAVVLKDSAGTAMEQIQFLRTLVIPRFPNSHKIGRFTVYWRP